MSKPDPTIGIIANPVSARDIRRVIANANNLQVSDRANIVLRVLASAGACGVARVLMMPDKGGIRAMLERSLIRERNLNRDFPALEFLEMDVTSSVEDTFRAARMMRERGVKAIIVLGGDGTHRAVVRECGSVPIAGLSTGTNNAFPEMREPTITGLAVGLYATGRLPAATALQQNKVLQIDVNDGERTDIALVDAVVCAERYVGARALWKTESLHALYVTFADPEAIGMSAIAGLLQPLTRRDAGGLAVEIVANGEARIVLHAPIAPGMVRPVGIGRVQAMPAGEKFCVALRAGVIALDGERELEFNEADRVSVMLKPSAFRTVDVSACMHAAARSGLFAERAQVLAASVSG